MLLRVRDTNLQIVSLIILALAVGVIYFDIDSEEDNVENVFSDRYVCIVYEG